MKMLRDGLARGLEVEAALAVEAAWELKVAVASMVLAQTWMWTRHRIFPYLC